MEGPRIHLSEMRVETARMDLSRATALVLQAELAREFRRRGDLLAAANVGCGQCLAYAIALGAAELSRTRVSAPHEYLPSFVR